ncbi:MAG: hypothetical protein AB7U85_09865 [Alphaproteobacteria bacterium]
MSIMLEGEYAILVNDDDEVMISMASKLNDPENPRIIYDGGDHALYYRTPLETILLDYINPEVREALQKVKILLVAEVEIDEERRDGEVIRAFDVPLQMVKKLPLSGELAHLPTIDELFDKIEAEIDMIAEEEEIDRLAELEGD